MLVEVQQNKSDISRVSKTNLGSHADRIKTIDDNIELIYTAICAGIKKQSAAARKVAGMLAIQFNNKPIDYTNVPLMKAIYIETFKLKGLFKKSKVAGFSIFSTKTLEQHLQDEKVITAAIEKEKKNPSDSTFGRIMRALPPTRRRADDESLSPGETGRKRAGAVNHPSK